jgi:AcrR family transcriptional regulator
MSSQYERISERIAEAAMRLVERHGADGFTMEDLARASGVGRATLYRQARSRGAVLASLAERGADLGERVDIQDRILAAARVVFTRAGFDAATLEDIAREAQVGAATVYRQFNDKEGLIRAFADKFGPRRAMRDIAVHPSGDLRADLERAAATALRFSAENLDLMKLALLERMRGGRWAEQLKSSPVSSQKTLARVFKAYAGKGALPKEEDPRKLARAFSGMLMAFVIAPIVESAPLPDPDETARFITRVFLDGVGARRR